MTHRRIIHFFASLLAVGLMVHTAVAEEVRFAQKGDKITIRRSALSRANNVITINWNQNSKARAVDYIQTAAKYTVDGNDGSVVIFIQKDMLDDFLSDCEGGQTQPAGSAPGAKCSIVVNSDFQYGTDKNKTMRFLVYHDKSYKPYQQSFACAMGATQSKSFGATMGGFFDKVSHFSMAPATNTATTTTTATSTAISTATTTANSTNATTIISSVISTTTSTNNPEASTPSIPGLPSGAKTAQIQADVQQAQTALGFLSKVMPGGSSASGDYLENF